MKIIQKLLNWLANDKCPCGGTYVDWDWKRAYCDKCGKKE